MKINVQVFIRVTAEGDIDFAQANSQGVIYPPIEFAKANDLHRFTFQIEGDEDKTPALGVRAADGMGVGVRFGG